MKTPFAEQITAYLSIAFVFCPKNGVPSIQVGDGTEGDIIFWLKYNNEGINKCASHLLQESGREKYREH